MTRYEDCTILITAVADALGPYKSEVVFLGGSIAGLLITSTFLMDVRPTDDVDIVVEAATYAKYQNLIEKLRKMGFQHVIDGPICRFTVHGVTVDIMPTKKSILSFSNKWYPLVVKTAVDHKLPNESIIRLVNAPMFICTKLEAFKNRGKGDFVSSHDMEDIIAIINGRDELICESWGMPPEVRDYLSISFQKLQKDDNFLNALPGMLPRETANRESIVLFKISQLAKILNTPNFSGQIMVSHTREPLEITVSSMIGTTQQFSSREFNVQEEFLQCLSDLGIQPDLKKMNQDGYNMLHPVTNIPFYTLAKWWLLNPID